MRPDRVPESVRRDHAALSPQAAELLDQVASRPEMLDISAGAAVDLPAFGTTYPYPVLPWPTFVGGECLAELRVATVAVPSLVKTGLLRMFERDPARTAALYGFRDVRVVEAILKQPNGVGSALARTDFLLTETGFQCLEVNMTASLGGWQLRFVEPWLRSIPWLREVIDGLGDRCRVLDPLPLLMRHLSDQGRRSGVAPGGALNTAFVFPEGEWTNRIEPMVSTLARTYDGLMAELDDRTGGRLTCVRHGDLALEEDRIVSGGRRIHAVVELQRATTDPRLFRCQKAGTVDLYNGPATVLLRDKRNLALLSENVDSDLFDAREAETIRRYIPWSRTTRSGSTRFRGETVELPGFALRHRELFVLKPATGARGDAIYIGDETPEPIWEQVVTRAFESGSWVLQERIRSKPYHYPSANGTLAPHNVTWGLFAFGDRYGGGFLRMMTLDRGAVVNAARGATVGLIAEVDDPPARPAGAASA